MTDRLKRWRKGEQPEEYLAALVVGAILITIAAWMVAPNLTSLVHWSDALPKPEPSELDQLSVGVRWVLVPIGIVLLAAAITPAFVVGASAAIFIAVALYQLGKIPAEVVILGKAGDGAWPSSEQAAHLATAGTQLLLVVIVVSLVIVMFRGDWSTFAATLIACVGVGAVLLAAVAALKADVPAEPAVVHLTVKGSYVGRGVDAKDPLTVLFIVPKLDDNGSVTGYESKKHEVTAEEAAPCVSLAPCTIRILVERGEEDADMATWFADLNAAMSVKIVGPSPTGAPSASPGT